LRLKSLQAARIGGKNIRQGIFENGFFNWSALTHFRAEVFRPKSQSDKTLKIIPD
jgi:hypothetical protein